MSTSVNHQQFNCSRVTTIKYQDKQNWVWVGFILYHTTSRHAPLHSVYTWMFAFTEGMCSSVPGSALSAAGPHTHIYSKDHTHAHSIDKHTFTSSGCSAAQKSTISTSSDTRRTSEETNRGPVESLQGTIWVNALKRLTADFFPQITNHIFDTS